MIEVATSNTSKDFTAPGRCVDMPTQTTGLRRVMGGDLDQLPSLKRKLVSQELCEESPSNIEDSSRKTFIGLDHVTDLKLLDYDDTVALGIIVTELMQEVLALTLYGSAKDSDSDLCFTIVARSFLSSRDSLLHSLQTFQRSRVEAR